MCHILGDSDHQLIEVTLIDDERAGLLISTTILINFDYREFVLQPEERTTGCSKKLSLSVNDVNGNLLVQG